MFVPALFFLFFLISAAVAAGPLEAATLAVVVDLVETSLLVGVEIIVGSVGGKLSGRGLRISGWVLC